MCPNKHYSDTVHAPGAHEQTAVQIEETSVPNRRRRRLSTATSAFAALAVASPFAYIAVCDLTAKPAPQHHEFVRAASMTDLPGELMGALTQGLSQFGVTLPPIPSLTGATSPRQHGSCLASAAPA